MLFSGIFIVFFQFMACFSCDQSESYNRLINKAEEHIIDGRYSRASSCYQKAFKTTLAIRSDDLFNALLASQKSEHYDLLFFAAQKLVKRGICFDAIKESLAGIEASTYEDLQQQSIDFEPANFTYREKLEALLDSDQNIRMESRKDRYAIRSIDSLNYIQFKELLRDYGFPSDDRIGIRCTFNQLGIAPSPVDIPLLHFAQQRFDGVENILQTALDSNHISPYVYMDYVTYLDINVKYLANPVIKMGEDYYTYRLNRKVIDEINRNRKKIGAVSLDKHIARIKQYIEKGFNRYRLYSLIEHHPVLPEEEIKSNFIKL